MQNPNTSRKPFEGVVTKVIVHKGQAHSDDLLSLCIALPFLARPVGNGSEHEFPPVYRRDPTPTELEDPTVLVMDVGGQHDPSKLNFDHHQLPKDAAPCCALTLVARHMGFEEDLRGTKWFPAVEMIDSKGPFAWARANKLDGFPMGLLSPIEGALKERLALFHDDEPVPQRFLAELMGLGAMILGHATKAQEIYLHTKAKAEVVMIGGVLGLYFPEKDISGLERVRNEISTEARPIGFSITKDDRGEGMTLYRFNDDKRIDFSKLANNQEISFVHPGKFIAKTRRILSKIEALELVACAII